MEINDDEGSEDDTEEEETDDDIDHYQKILVANSETIRIMKEIDEVIDEHGGWPGAFKAK